MCSHGRNDPRCLCYLCPHCRQLLVMLPFMALKSQTARTYHAPWHLYLSYSVITGTDILV